MKRKQKKLVIEIIGENTGDLELAMEEVLTKVKQGYLSGFDSNDTGSFKFNIEEK